MILDTDTLLGTLTRSDPNDVLACFFPDCLVKHKSSAFFAKHMAKHNNDEKVKLTSTKFPITMTRPPSPQHDMVMDVDTVEATPLDLAKFGLQIVSLDMLNMQPAPNLLVCLDCGCGLPPKSTFEHLKFHNIAIQYEEKSTLGEIIADMQCVDHKTTLPIPEKLAGPIPHLKVFDAWKCALCNFCSASSGSFKPHFARLHSTKLGTHAANTLAISAQQYFRNAYCFQVTPSLAGLKSGNPYELYLKKFKPTLTTIDLFPAPASVNEIAPLLRLTQWHEHLKDFIDTRAKVEELLALFKLPTSVQGNPTLGQPLQGLIDDYLRIIRNQANSTTIGVKCLLMECPR